MLASRFRLKGKNNFARVEIDGKLTQSKSFGLAIYNRGDNETSLFGIVISTKISKRAVVRNRVKRIVSDTLRINLNRIKQGLDVIFLMKPSVLKISREELEREINEVITKNLQK